EEPARHRREHQRDGADDHPVAELDEVLRQRHAPLRILLRPLPAPWVLLLHQIRGPRAQERCVESSSVCGSACCCADPPVTSSTVGADERSWIWRGASSEAPLSFSLSVRRSSTSDLNTLSDLPMFFAI